MLSAPSFSGVVMAVLNRSAAGVSAAALVLKNQLQIPRYGAMNTRDSAASSASVTSAKASGAARYAAGLPRRKDLCFINRPLSAKGAGHGPGGV